MIENGKNFSSTERKKIMLARFLYSDRDIYLFDFFFDYFPQSSGLLLYNSIVNDFLSEKTIIFIANKEAFVSQADYVYIFELGTVVQHGTPTEVLLSDKQYYQNMVVKPSIEESNFKFNKKQMMSSLGKEKLIHKWSNVIDTNNMTREISKGIFKVSKSSEEIDPNKILITNLIKTIADVYRKKNDG